MQGAKKSKCHCSGGDGHQAHCTYGKRRAYDIRWQDIRKRLRDEFFFDGKRMTFHYNPNNYTYYFHLDGELLLCTATVGASHFYNLYPGFRQYQYQTVLKLIDDYFNVAKSELL